MLAAAACSAREAPVEDAAPDRARADAAPPPSDVPVALAVDFTVENCPHFDGVQATCTGKVPLAVRFVPLATTTVTTYLWDFGDGTVAEGVGPSHVYTSPNIYTVKIIATGAGGGLVTKVRTGFIIAEAAAAGGPCESDVQCGLDQRCICGGAGCATGPGRAVCAGTCASGRCPVGQVCAGLLTAATAGDPEAWQDALCLPACAGDADCQVGLRCRTLPPGPTGSAWVRGCFGDEPRDVGEPCMDVSGKLRNDLCASGLCVRLGALGMCSADCAVASCPPGSDCAELGDGRSACLRSCLGFDCARDALLACIAPGPGDLGYRLVDAQPGNAGSSYCAPKPCIADADCLPIGYCANATGQGHCVRR